MDAPTLIIGGAPATLAPVTFAAVKALVPIFGRMSGPKNALEMRDTMVEALAVLLGETADAITGRIVFREFDAIDAQWPAIMEWIGLVAPKPGEATATN